MPKLNRATIPHSGGMLHNLTIRAKLVIRLVGDARVKPLLKLLPVGSLAYLILFPDLLLGPFDDAAIIWLAIHTFLELCPSDVIQEHLKDLTRTEQVLSQYGVAQPVNNEPRTMGGAATESTIIDGKVVETAEQD